MNRQEAFDVVWQRFVVDKARAGYIVDDEECVYIGDDGRRCAIGALCTEVEAGKLSSGNVGAVWGQLPKKVAGLGIGFLRFLQLAHDNAATESAEEDFHEAVEAKLRGFAKTWALEVK